MTVVLACDMFYAGGKCDCVAEDVFLLSVMFVAFFCPNCCFIALIHPIQWTIAYPVGADRPAKRQKKTSCVSTG